MKILKRISKVFFLVIFLIVGTIVFLNINTDRNYPNKVLDKVFQRYAQRLNVNDTGRWPVKDNGRIKPLFVLAQEIAPLITAKNNFWELNSLQFYLALSSFPQSEHIELINLRSFKLINELKLNQQKSFFSLDELKKKNFYQLLAPLLDKQKNMTLSFEEKEMMEDLMRINLFDEITKGEHFIKALFLEDGDVTSDFRTNVNSFLAALRQKNQEIYQHQSEQLFRRINEQKSSPIWEEQKKNVTTEIFYWNGHFFILALGILFLLVVSLIIFRKTQYAALNLKIVSYIAVLPLILIIVAIYLRLKITNCSNLLTFYESVIWIGGGLCFLGWLVIYFKKSFEIGIFLWSISGLLFLLSESSSFNLNPYMNPSNLSFKSNIWFIWYAVTFLMSCIFLLSSWLVTCLANWSFWFQGSKNDRVALFGDINHHMIKFGLIFLCASFVFSSMLLNSILGSWWEGNIRDILCVISIVFYFIIFMVYKKKWVQPLWIFCWTMVGFFLLSITWYFNNLLFITEVHSIGIPYRGLWFIGALSIEQICEISMFGSYYYMKIFKKKKLKEELLLSKSKIDSAKKKNPKKIRNEKKQNKEQIQNLEHQLEQDKVEKSNLITSAHSKEEYSKEQQQEQIQNQDIQIQHKIQKQRSKKSIQNDKNAKQSEDIIEESKEIKLEEHKNGIKEKEKDQYHNKDHENKKTELIFNLEEDKVTDSKNKKKSKRKKLTEEKKSESITESITDENDTKEISEEPTIKSVVKNDNNNKKL